MGYGSMQQAFLCLLVWAKLVSGAAAIVVAAERVFVLVVGSAAGVAALTVAVSVH